MRGTHAKGDFALVLIACFLSGLVVTTHVANAQEEGSVIIGINVPLTGPYIDQGIDEERAYKLAIEQINAKGGVIGKKISFVVKDTKSNVKVAKKNALDLIRLHKAVMVTGGVSSAVAIAQSDVCQEQKVVFMAALTHSNATTGHMKTKAGHTVQKAHRHTFRWFLTAWMTGKALAPFLVERYGTGTDYFYITADYTWGHSLERSMRWVTELNECDTLGAIRTPLGQKDFKRELLKAKNAKPDVLVLILFGKDLIVSLKQAHVIGLSKKMKIVVPLMEEHMAHEVGPEVMEGVISTLTWYSGLSKRFAGSRKFVNAFKSKYGKPPGTGGAAAWVAIHEWASAVERAGSFASNQVIKALEGHKFTLLKDQEEWRSWDHQAISSVFIVEGKSKKESKGEWDLLKVIGAKKGSSVMRTREQNPIYLEPLAPE
ncbi:MAG: hypothetical protein BBJ60_11750 [Desulfobacterales bacterium S7086C20]|nr:MAG: hypothetical protein BBJ60_11750 [Desulfobacterales bacterium S7086C20]